MTDTQERLLMLLEEVDDICRKNNIVYYLAGGSLIGAVRHNGFLPWDDDADIHMTIDNAIRFKEAVEREGKPGRSVYVKSENGDWMNSHWRYEDNNTTLLMRGLTGSTGAQGQFVDIFPLYPMPLGEEEKERCLMDLEIYVELKAQNNVMKSLRSPEYLELFAEYKKREKEIGKQELIRELEDRLFHYSYEEADELMIVSPHPPRRNIPKDWWGTPRRVKFERLMLPIAERGELIIASAYGTTWFEIPGYADRGEHVFVTDYEIPYTVYTAEYNKYLDSRAFYDQEVERKDYWFSILPMRNKLNSSIRSLQGVRTALEVCETIREYGLDPVKMVEEGRKEELASVFARYYEAMGQEAFRYWGTYMDMPDDYLYAAFYFSCFDGTFGKAKKVFKARRDLVDRELSPRLARLCELCDATDELAMAMYAWYDHEQAWDLVCEWLPREPEALYFQRAKIALLLERSDGSDYEEILSECNSFLEMYPEDGELMKYKGDILLAQGKTAEGELLYRRAADVVKNGFCLRDIRGYFAEKDCREGGFEE